MRYQYWTIRYVPDPVRGEYVNIGVLAGSADQADWALRYVNNTRRANFLGGDADRAVAYLHGLRRLVDDTFNPAELMIARERLSSELIERLRVHQRNSIQLAAPRAVAAASAQAAVDLLYPLMVDEPERRTRDSSRNRIVSDFKASLDRNIRSSAVSIHRNMEGHVGRQRGKLDFVLEAGGRAQLAHAWSFRTLKADSTREGALAWSWFLNEFRQSGMTVPSSTGRTTLELPPSTPLLVLHDTPKGPAQEEAFAAASQAWERLDVEIRPTTELVAAVEDVRSHLALAV